MAQNALVQVALSLTLLSAPALAQCEFPALLAPSSPDVAQFGQTLLLEGNEVVVGNASGLFGLSPCYVFESNAGEWSAQPGDLLPDNFTTTYGYGVARQGDTVIVAGQDVNDATIAGYVFDRVDGAWQFSGHLIVPGFGFHLSAGLRVAVEDDVALVSDYLHNVCWVFERQGGDWQLTQQLYPDVEPWVVAFGYSVVLENGLALISGSDSLPDNHFPGVAWIFERQGGSFVEVGKLAPIEGETNDNAGVGNALVIDGDTVVMGAPSHDLLSGENLNYGAAFVFERQAGVWTQTQMLSAPGARPGDGFGHALALQGDTLLVGAPWHDKSILNGGAVYSFHRGESGLFEFGSRLLDPTPEFGAQFGRALALDGDTALVSAPYGSGGEGGLPNVRQFRGLNDLDAWTSWGGAVAGAAGTPCLYGTGSPAIGAPASVELNRAPPSSAGFLVVGLAALELGFKGGTLVPAPDFLVARTSDAHGHAQLAWSWPASIPTDTRFWFQAWWPEPSAPAGFAASGAVQVNSP